MPNTPFTVILLYPLYCADLFGENYLAHVMADNRESAIAVARLQCDELNGGNCVEDLSDLFPVAVFDGHISETSLE